MSIRKTKTYQDPDTCIALIVDENCFEISVDGEALYFREIQNFSLKGQLTYMIDLFTAAKADLDKLQ